MCLRAPLLIEPGRIVADPVSSVDLAPTILSLLGVEVDAIRFDGVDALAPLPHRKVPFAGWMQQGPSGFIEGDRKFIYDPEHKKVWLYRLKTDPLELSPFDLPEYVAQAMSQEIVQWRRDTIFRLDQAETGQLDLYDDWVIKWKGRISSVSYRRSD
jgi:arylsulfatase A-like enzyme